MRCPSCKGSDFLTVDSRDYHANRIKRRKKCACGYRWNTFEYVENIFNKRKAVKRCDYIGCNKPTLGSGSRVKYCPEHWHKWETFRRKLHHNKTKQNKILEIPIQFNRKPKR